MHQTFLIIFSEHQQSNILVDLLEDARTQGDRGDQMAKSRRYSEAEIRSRMGRTAEACETRVKRGRPGRRRRSTGGGRHSDTLQRALLAVLLFKPRDMSHMTDKSDSLSFHGDRQVLPALAKTSLFEQ